MGAYFSYLPLLAYEDIQQDDPNKQVILTNLLTRSAFLQEVITNTSLFYDYQVKENETPEIIAHKLYGDVERFWIVLMFNKLMNPFYDFPLNSEQLEDTIVDKYGYSVEDAQTIAHHYERRIKRDVLLNGIVQSSNTDTVTVSAYEADPTTGIATLNPWLDGLSPDSGVTYDTTTEVISDGTSVVTTYEYWFVSIYAYEFNENEKRRSIKLLDAAYVSRVENELKRLMTNG